VAPDAVIYVRKVQLRSTVAGALNWVRSVSATQDWVSGSKAKARPLGYELAWELPHQPTKPSKTMAYSVPAHKVGGLLKAKSTQVPSIPETVLVAWARTEEVEVSDARLLPVGSPPETVRIWTVTVTWGAYIVPKVHSEIPSSVPLTAGLNV
jgi:hypothetical protein